ncbi:MAG: endo-1,4-beta-xylanase [Acidobacteria bacterium]|nr:MAG: endo-1,4-beta-xylanase [Acidobacteriota bacterium]PYY21928.1 MAG: endo-1,4-beta-xylanase [Acidobacteriota bacterium]
MFVLPVAAVVCLLGSSTDTRTLRNAAHAKIHLGSAVRPGFIIEDSRYATTLAREFDQLEPENEMKWSLLRPARDQFDFGPADELVRFAQQNKMAVRGHTLLWHQAVPKWLGSGNWTWNELSQLMADHIQTVVKHFAGSVYAWDVVNEAFHPDGSLRSTIWYDSPGIGAEGPYGYIERAFVLAHAADPKAKLFYNDYAFEGGGPKFEAILAMARDFKKRGVPIDGIGFQCHFALDSTALARLERTMRAFTDLGLEVQITELDIRLPLDSAGQANPHDLERQAQQYGNVVRACLAVRGCTAIQVWGFSDAHSWITRSFPGYGAGTLFDQQYRPKPAYGVVLDLLSRHGSGMR